jgi:hypothetical protein
VFSTPHLAAVAEEGPEAIIPLTKPGRAAQVMEQAGLANTVDLEPLLQEVRAMRTDLQRTNTRIIRALAGA